MRETSKEKKVSETVPEKQANISKLKGRGKSILDRGTTHSYPTPIYVKTLEDWPILGTESNSLCLEHRVVRDESGEVDVGIMKGHIALAKV